MVTVSTARLAQLIRQTTGVRVTDPEQPLASIIPNSLAYLEVLTGCQDAFGVNLDFTGLGRRTSVAQLAELIRASLASVAAEPAPAAAAQTDVEPTALDQVPLNPMQQAYLLGSAPGLELGGTATFLYLELRLPCAADRAADLIGQLLDRHQVFACRLEPAAGWIDLEPESDPVGGAGAADGPSATGPDSGLCPGGGGSGSEPHPPAAPTASARPRLVLQPAAGQWSWPIHRPDGWEAARALTEPIRQRLLDQARRSNRTGRLHGWEIVGLPDGGSRVCLYLNMIIADAASGFVLVGELDALLRDQRPPQPTGYLAAAAALERRRGAQRRQRARDYWRAKAADLPPGPRFQPGLALYEDWSTRRRSVVLEPALVARLRQRAERLQVSLSAVFLALHAVVLARWANNPRFSLNLTVTERARLTQTASLMGDFTSSLLVGFDLARAESIDQLVETAYADIGDGLPHLAYSGVEVMQEFLRPAADQRAALMPVVFTSYLDGDGPAPGLSVDFAYTQTAQVFLDLQVTPQRDSVALSWDYVPEYFGGSVDDMFEALLAALEEYAAGGPVLPLTDAKTAAAVASYNHTAVERPAGDLMTGLRHNFRRRPDRIALVSRVHDVHWTYADLDRRSAQLAWALTEAGVGQGQVVLIESTKHPCSIVNQLAVLRVGGVFVPVNAHHPAERKAYMAQVAGAVETVLNDASWATLAAGRPTEFPDAPIDPADLAYIIFTSGSTGRPKGVEISHAGAVNTIADINARFQVGPRDVVIGLSSLSFDLSIYDIYGAFAAGARLTMVDDERDADEILSLLESDRVTIWNSTPALVELTLIRADPAQSCPSLRLLMLSGDRIAFDLPARAAALFPAAAVHSLGGATEGSVWSIAYPLDGPGDPSRIPYGYPLDNQTIWVLGYDDRLCPIGVPGEICIGGAGLAAGYRGEPDKTAAAFGQVEPFGRIYRTGDVGLFNRAGYVEFLGRRDRQVKIRGHRIELGEVEAVLRQSPGVRRGEVALVQAQGRPALAAFVTPRGPLEAFDPESVKITLTTQLPDYMVPQFVVGLAELPTTAHGKVDQAALQNLVDRLGSGAAAATSSEPGLARMREIWRSVLGRPVDDDHASFLSLGGDSLKFQELLRQITLQTGHRLRFRDVIAEPTVSHLSALLTRAEAAGAPGPAGAGAESVTEPADGPAVESVTGLTEGPAAEPPAVEVGGPCADPGQPPGSSRPIGAGAPVEPAADDPHAPFPLTDMQLAYLVGRGEGFALGGVSEHYYIESENVVELDRLEAAFNALIARHPMLRAVIGDDGSQRVLPSVPPYRIESRDLSQLSPDQLEEAIQRRRAQLSHQVFDPGRWPQYEFSAFALGGGRHRLFFSVDLLLADGASQRILVEDLTRLYEGRPPLPIEGSFRDYVLALGRRQRSPWGDLEPDRLDQLVADFPIGNFLPCLEPAGRPAPERFGGPTIRRLSHRFDPEQAAALRQAAAGAGVSVSALCCAAYANSLSLWSIAPRVGVNVTTYNRDPGLARCRNVIGDFTGVAPLSFDATWPRDNFEAARAVQTDLLEHLDAGYSGVRLISEIARRRGAVGQAVAPFVFTSLLFEDGERAAGRRGSVLGEFKYALSQTPQVLLDNQLIDLDGAVAVSWDYVEAFFAADLMEELFQHYIASLTACAAGDPELPPQPPASARAVKRALLEVTAAGPARAERAPGGPTDAGAGMTASVGSSTAGPPARSPAAPAQSAVDPIQVVAGRADLNSPAVPDRPVAAAVDPDLTATVLAWVRDRLGVSPGPLDNLFQAGLDSLSFVELIKLVEARTGRRVPLALALGDPSAARLAALAGPLDHDADGSAPAGQSLVWLRPGPGRIKAILVHGGFGGVDVYKDLALALPADWDVWGLRFDAFARPHPRPLTIERIAQLYADEVRRLCGGAPPDDRSDPLLPTWPRETDPTRAPVQLVLVGWSVGGTIAAELALRLDQDFDLDLILLDALAPGIEAEVGDFSLAAERRLVEAQLDSGPDRQARPEVGFPSRAASGVGFPSHPASVVRLPRHPARSAAESQDPDRQSTPSPNGPERESTPDPASVAELWAGLRARLDGRGEADLIHRLARAISPRLLEDLGAAGQRVTIEQFSTLRSLIWARNHYRPAGRLERLGLIGASDGEAWNLADWSCLAGPGLEIQRLDGNHYSIMIGPGADPTAQAIVAHLSRQGRIPA
jgi:amino acid adenylation domain-containing protein